MKNILKLSLSFLFISLLMVSCEVDDDSAVTINSEDVVVSLENEIVRLPGGSTIVNVPVTLSKVVPQLSQITYTLDGEEFTQDVNTGGTSFNIEVDMSGFIFRQLEITDFHILYSESESLQSVVSSNNTTDLIIGDDAIVIMTWDMPAVDIDLALTSGDPNMPLVNTDANLEELSNSTDPMETVSVLAASSFADGEYVASIVPFVEFNTPINFTITVVGDQVVSREVTLNSGLAADAVFFGPTTYFTVVPVYSVTKTTNGDVVSYSIEEL